jgi:predicted nuclease with TOPRIM domain
MVTLERQAKDGLRQSQRQKAQAIADARNAIGRLQAIVDENGCRVLEGAQMGRTNEELGAEVGGLKLRVEVLEQENRRLSEAKELRPQNQEARSLSSDFSELIAVVLLRSGSRLANVAVRDWPDDFTFLIGDYRYRWQSSVAQFL